MKDRFSRTASAYAKFRPLYPQELYDFLFSQAKAFDQAWDCGCGNGQVAKILAGRFAQVNATDISSKQLENALQAPNIHYTLCAAEKTPFNDNTFDLITIGQALHWFDLALFFTEAYRVAKPGALIAAWGYGLLRITPDIDVLIGDFYTRTIGPYWDKERAMVDDRYQSINFPFEPLTAPSFQFSFQWTLDELVGYLCTWSSVQNYILTHGSNPVEPLQERLKTLWGDGTRQVHFPLFLRCGYVTK